MIATVLHIILVILKIIGITLGILIGIILLVLCAALFIPVRYRIEAERTEGEGNPPVKVMAKVSWLLHFINAKVQYASKLNLRLRILFITIFKIPGKPRKAGKFGRKSQRQKNGRSGTGEFAGKKNNLKEEKIENGNGNTVTEDKNNIKDAGSAKSENFDYFGQQDGEEEDTEEKLSIKDKLIKIWDFFVNIRYTIEKLCDKIKGISENVEYYTDIIQGELFKASFGLCKGELVSILSYIRPREVKAELVIGAGDPAATGQIISYYYSVLYPYIGSDVTVIGDFDNKRIEGTVFIKGKVKLFTFLKAVIRIYFNKDIKNLLKLFKKED
ncbi:MAG: hypothetical protein J1E98_13920 [Lachnospiraceae bacterium]|nr:hypothetical protein [Lachnospiraceae bacterium]